MDQSLDHKFNISTKHMKICTDKLLFFIYFVVRYKLRRIMSNKLYIKIFNAAVVLTLAGLIYSCANPLIPQGGPKDIEPPIEMEAEPVNFSTNFNESSARVWFNEFIELKDLHKQLLVSPPLEENPNITIRGKSIIIELEDTLLENTTYTIFMGDAIVDITEKNPIKNFQYVFSTGDHIDSLELEGSLVDAFTKDPTEDATIMLYRSMEDSIPMKERPVYISKTDKQGKFKFRNLADGGYKIFALVDANSNYLYDLPNEPIGYLLDTVFPVLPKRTVKPDSLSLDTIALDSLTIDSVYTKPLLPDSNRVIQSDTVSHEKSYYNTSDTIQSNQEAPITDSTFQQLSQMDSLYIDTLQIDSLTKEQTRMDSIILEDKQKLELLLFIPKDTVQKVLESLSYKKRNISIYFQQPTDSASFNILNKKSEFNFIFTDWNTKRDSVTLWMDHFDSDSLEVEIKDYETVIDTLVFTYFDNPKTKKDSTKIEKLKITANTKSTIELNQRLILNFKHPIQKQLDTAFRFINGDDTTTITVQPIDSLKRDYLIEHKWESLQNYELLIPDSAFMDIYGLSNDSTNFKFSGRNIEDYTRILLNFDTEYDSTLHIIQLLTEKNDIVREFRTYENQQITFDFLPVKKYRLRAIIDKNGNETWDTGDYIKKKQPEPVIYLQSKIETRANWDVEQDWKIKKP